MLYHIIVHALFKSLLFLLAGSLIHISFNYQSIFRLRSSSLIIKILFIISLSVLIINFSKESIIYSLIINLNSFFISFIAIFGILCSFLYSIKLIIYLFSSSSLVNVPSLFNSFNLASSMQATSVWSYFNLGFITSFNFYNSFLLISYSLSALLIDS
jgi:hypothetical protein